jgi:hypothetical protein
MKEIQSHKRKIEVPLEQGTDGDDDDDVDGNEDDDDDDIVTQ